MSLTSSLSGGGGSGGVGGVGGSTGAADNRLLRSDGVGGSTLQASSVVLVDNGSIDLPVNAEISSGFMGLILKGAGYDGPTFFDGDLVRGIEYDWTNISAERRRILLDVDGTEVLRDSTQTLTNKTLTDPVFSGGVKFKGYTSSADAASVTELPADKNFSIHKNTTSGAVHLAFNDGGVIKSVALT